MCTYYIRLPAPPSPPPPPPPPPPPQHRHRRCCHRHHHLVAGPQGAAAQGAVSVLRRCAGQPHPHGGGGVAVSGEKEHRLGRCGKYPAPLHHRAHEADRRQGGAHFTNCGGRGGGARFEPPGVVRGVVRGVVLLHPCSW
eukprot:gene13909-biopygen18594